MVMLMIGINESSTQKFNENVLFATILINRFSQKVLFVETSSIQKCDENKLRFS